MKYLGINLAKNVQNLYSEKCKTLFRKIKGNLNKWRFIPCLWMERLIAIKMSLLLQLLYRFNSFPPNIPEGVLWKLQIDSEMHRKMLRT